jgi:hypothetical protein
VSDGRACHLGTVRIPMVEKCECADLPGHESGYGHPQSSRAMCGTDAAG